MATKVPPSSTKSPPPAVQDGTVAASVRAIQTMATSIAETSVSVGGGIHGGFEGADSGAVAEARSLAGRLSAAVEECAKEADVWRLIPSPSPSSHGISRTGIINPGDLSWGCPFKPRLRERTHG